MNIGFKPPNPKLNRVHPLAKSLLLCLPFEDRGGTRYLDISGRNNHGIEETTGTRERARFGGGSSFAPAVYHINLGPADKIALPTESITICAIYKKDDATNRNSGVFGVDSSDANLQCSASGPRGNGRIEWNFGGFTVGTSRLRVSGQPASIFETAIWIWTAGPRGMEIWRNGELLLSQPGHVSRATSSIDFFCGAGLSFLGDDATYQFFAVFDGQLPTTEIISYSNNPFSLITPEETIAYIIPAAGGSVTGTSAITLPLPTIDFTGVSAHIGSSSINLPLPILSSTGLASTAITGTSAITLPLPTLEVTGNAHSDILGLGLIILPLPTLSVSGSTAGGISSITLPLLTMSASGDAKHVGTSSITLPLPTLSATGNAHTAVTGTSSITLPLPTSSATGIASTAISGTSSITLPLPTMEASSASITLVNVCTNIELGTPIVFLACDDIKITIDGPAANTVRISSTVEFEA